MERGGGGRLLTFSIFRTGAYSTWALIRGWALIRINTVYGKGNWDCVQPRKSRWTRRSLLLHFSGYNNILLVLNCLKMEMCAK